MTELPVEPTYTYINENEIDEELKCMDICYQPLIEPYTHNQCGRSFCKVCIKKTNYKCPTCGNGIEKDFNKINIRLVLNQLDKLKVQCSNCHFKLNRGDFKDHINICFFSCPLNCGEIINRKTFDNHKNKCSNKVQVCPSYDIGCCFKAISKDLENHVKSCSFITLRPIIIEMLDKNKELENRLSVFVKESTTKDETIINLQSTINQYNQKYEEQCNINYNYQNRLSSFEKQTEQLKLNDSINVSKIVNLECENRELKNQVISLKEQLQQNKVNLSDPNNVTQTIQPNHIKKSYMLNVIRYKGTWCSGGRNRCVFHFIMSLEKNILDDGSIIPIKGVILWKLVKVSPESHLYNRIGDSGSEFVEGNFDIENRMYQFRGISMDKSAKGLLALDEYRFVESENENSFIGITRGNDNRWSNKISGERVTTNE
jgi:hypothetical protein